MNFSFLSPVSDRVLAHSEVIASQALGKKIKIHTDKDGIPDLDDVNIAIIGVKENRNDADYIEQELHFDDIRLKFYSLFPGNWHLNIADLGDIAPGETVEDSYFAVKTAISILLEKQIIPILIGGGQDVTFANYRAYDSILPMINIVNVDVNFDLGDANLPIKNNSYIGKVIVDEPFNLFNYAVIGYQTYFNSQEEIDLIEKLHFEAYRLGEVSANINIVEPLMRDANIVSVDLRSVQASELSDNIKYSPNGFSGKEICAICRYAGISNKVSSFGIHEYKNSNSDSSISDMLIAQMLWYFIEGVNYRIKDDDFKNENHYQKYTVLVEDYELIFYKSLKTGRWWVEIPFLESINNKLKKHTLLACTHTDYLNAVNRQIPERWYKAFRKNSF